MKKTTLLSGTVSLPQNLLKKLLLSCFAMVVMLSSYAAAISSIATGNWNATTTWSTGTVPGVGDVVTISAGNTVTVNIAGAICSGITINGGTLVLQNLVGGLTVDGPWVFTSGTFTPNVQTVTFGTGGSIGGAIATSFYNLTINTTSSTDVVSLLTSGVSILYASGGSVLTLTNGIFKIGAGNTLNLGFNQIVTIIATGGNFAHSGDGAGDTDADGGTILVDGAPAGGGGNPFTVTATSANILQFYNLQFGTVLGNSNNNWKITNPGSVKINNLLTIQDNNWSLGSGNPPIYGANSTLSINNNNQGFTIPAGSNAAKLWTANAGTIGTTPGYPNNLILTNVGISQGGYKNGNGWVPGAISLGINGVLTLGSGATNAQVDFSNLTGFTCGGFVLNPGTRFTAPKTGIMTVNGNWTDNQAQVFSSGTPSNPTNPTAGFYINATSTINFGGPGTCGAANIIQAPGAGTETFYNVGIINGTYTKLNSPVTITNNLVLTSGILGTSNPTNILSVTNSAPTAISGGGAATYIDGPVKWSLQAAAGVYNFPVGSNGVACANDYLPFSLNKAAGATIATVQALTPGSGGTVDATLGVLSTTEYWSFATSAALSAGSTISVSRPTPITPLDSIAQSTTGATGTYTSIGGTPLANGVNNSRSISTNTSLFFTLGGPAAVSTLAATSITTTSVTLNGSFNTGSSKTTSFNYGLTAPAYGTTVNTLLSPINSTTAKLDSQFVTGLTANTVYHYQATDGTDNGGDVTFITAPNPPVVGTPNTPTVDGFTATWSAPAAMGSAPYTYTIEVSTDPTFASGVTTQAGISSASTSYVFTTLNSATQYYYRVKAVNATASSAWSATSTPISTLIFPTPACTSGNGSPGTTGTITSASTAPVIDGIIDPVWNTVPSNPINQTINVASEGSTLQSPPNNTATWKTIWDVNNLYILVQVQDATLVSQGPLAGATDIATLNGGAHPWDVDGIEFYLDGNDNKGGAYDNTNDFQFRFNLGQTTVTTGSTGNAPFALLAPRINYKMVVVPGGYLLEAAIPWSGAGGINSGAYPSVAAGNKIGIDFSINDNDGTAWRTAQTGWYDGLSGSVNQFNNTTLFGTATLATCPLPPTVVLPTVTNITATGATLGATVTSSGDAALTVRGTGISQSPDNSGSTNALPEGGTAVSIYSGPARTGLLSQTQYYYLGYATNANLETGVSDTATFFTLSALPATQPTLSACGANNSLVLNWSAVTFPPTSEATNTGYLILRRQDGTNPTTTGISTRIATVQSALPAGTTLVTTINGGSTVSYTDATAVIGTTYNYLLVPYSWDGVTADSTYNYLTAAAPTVAASIGGGSTPVVTIGNINSPIDLGIPIPLAGNSTVAGTASWTVSPSAPIADTSSLSTTSTPITVNTYTYTLTVNAGGCVGSAQATVDVIKASVGCLVIPNAFTPNGDTYNDTWIIQASCYTTLIVDVYNRWGSLMYHSDNYNSANPWDGKYHGENVPDGTYYYVVKAIGANDSPTKKGSLTIIR